MTLLDLLRAPWAITPDALLEMQEIYRVHLRGDKIDIAGIEARLGRPLANAEQSYQVRDGGVAVLTMEGVIAPKANLFMQICGGISAQAVIAQLDSMAVDSRIKSAALAIDSPGGSVQLIPAVAAAVRRLADAKPTVAVSGGTMASALYWIGSAANAVYMSGETDMIGSIGVVATHKYEPRSNGTVTTEITAGRYKRMASSSRPLDAESEAYMQSHVDELYRVFVAAVADNRRVTADQVHDVMADGRIWIGQQAMDRGLVDGIATVDDMVEQLATNPAKFATRQKATFAPGFAPSRGTGRASPNRAAAGAAAVASPQANEPVLPVGLATSQESQNMDPKELAATFAAENPDAAELLRAEGRAGEQARVAAVREQLVPGHEALINQLAADGKTTGAEAAMQVLAAVRTERVGAANAHFADAPAAAASSASAATAGTDVVTDKAEQTAKAKEYAASHGVDFVAAMKALGFAA